MKANKRVRDLGRRSDIKLVATGRDGVTRGTTTYPLLARKECSGWPAYASGRSMVLQGEYHPHVRMATR